MDPMGKGDEETLETPLPEQQGLWKLVAASC